MKRWGLAESANRDLVILSDFLGEQGEARAELVLSRLFDACDKIGTLPFRGRPRDEFGRGFRSLNVSGVTVIYRVDPDQVSIGRVIHAAADQRSLDVEGD
jgi:plasmid stabilization system protein ParE